VIKVFDKYSDIIKYVKIEKFEQFGLNLRLRGRVGFIDGSNLHIRETIIEGANRKYSYHWQDKEENCIIRWDNAPDWDVDTFPHHKHVGIGDKIESSYERTLEQVLKSISGKLK